MSISISREPGGFVVVNGSGIFNYSDLQAIQKAAKETFESGTMARCLITTTDFTGWGQDGDWGDLAFVHETDHLVSRIAVIGTEQSREQLLMFMGAGRRKAAVKFFIPGQEDLARSWLAEKWPI